MTKRRQLLKAVGATTGFALTSIQTAVGDDNEEPDKTEHPHRFEHDVKLVNNRDNDTRVSLVIKTKTKEQKISSLLKGVAGYTEVEYKLPAEKVEEIKIVEDEEVVETINPLSESTGIPDWRSYLVTFYKSGVSEVHQMEV